VVGAPGRDLLEKPQPFGQTLRLEHLLEAIRLDAELLDDLLRRKLLIHQ